jgi:hypothetical protein
VITFPAVLEHVAAGDISAMARHSFARLVHGGKVTATVPSPRADHVLTLLQRLTLIDGMSLWG